MGLQKLINQESFKPLNLHYTNSGIILWQERFLPHQINRQVILINYDTIENLIEAIQGKERNESFDQMIGETLHFKREFDGFYLMQNFIDRVKNTIPLQMDSVFIHEKTIKAFIESLRLLKKM